VPLINVHFSNNPGQPPGGVARTGERHHFTGMTRPRNVRRLRCCVEVGPDAFYLEDMILVTETGHRILSSGLPYTADEIERRMSGRR